MVHLRLAAILSAASLCAVFAFPAHAAESESVETVRMVDFSGRPPFKRRTVEVPLAPADVVRFDQQFEAGDRVQTVDFSGKPPFRRDWITLDEQDVVEFARFEEFSEEAARPQRSRRGPPGKGFGFRR